MDYIQELIDTETLVEWEGMVSFDVNLKLAGGFTSKWKEHCVKTFNDIENHLKREVEKEALDHFTIFQPSGLPNIVRYFLTY